MNEDKVLNTLEEHGKQFNRVFEKLDKHGQQFERVFTKLENHDQQFDRLISKIVEHDERFNRLEEKIDHLKEGLPTKQEYFDGQDKIMTVLNRLDQDRIFTHAWVRKIEEEVEQQKKQIAEHDTMLRRIKLDLEIA